MPLVRFPTPTGMVYTIDLSKIADRENPRTVEAPICGQIQEPTVIEWGDGSSDTVTTGTLPTHTYAEGAGDVFTVTIRSATGHLPQMYFNFFGSTNADPANNMSYAVTSVDHFNGESGSSAFKSGAYIARRCYNVQYIDPRYAGYYLWNSLSAALRQTALDQPIESFCFDFMTGVTSVTQLFYDAKPIHGIIPPKMFDNMTAITDFSVTFYNCKNLTGAPYIFWKTDGTLDTGKFTSISTGQNCYASCSDAMRAQVPTAYGGTMTV